MPRFSRPARGGDPVLVEPGGYASCAESALAEPKDGLASDRRERGRLPELNALILSFREGILRAFRNQTPLPLGKSSQHVRHQLACRTCRVDVQVKRDDCPA